MKARRLRSLLAVSLAGSLCLGAGQAFAHHSFAMYDRTKTVTVSGTVKSYVWANPHIIIDLVADDPKGGTVAWTVEGNSPSAMVRDGWTNRIFKPGDKIEIGVHPRKDGSPGGALADEQRIVVNGQTPKGVLYLQAPSDDLCER